LPASNIYFEKKCQFFLVLRVFYALNTKNMHKTFANPHGVIADFSGNPPYEF